MDSPRSNHTIRLLTERQPPCESSCRKLGVRNTGPANRMDVLPFFELLNTGVLKVLRPLNLLHAVFVTCVALILDIVAVTVAADAVAVEGELIIAQVDAAVANFCEESVSFVDRVQELEDSQEGSQEQDAILKPGARFATHCDYHVIELSDIFHRVEELQLSF